MQDRDAELAFYALRFGRNPLTEHISGGYDELHDLALGEVPSGRMLDLGCGTGAHAIRLANRGCSVLAADLSFIAVRAARDRFEQQGMSGLFMVADGEHLPLRDRSVEITWAALLLHHFPDVRPVIAEISRVTRRRVVTLDPNGHNLLTRLAFNVVNRCVRLRGLTPNQRALLPKRLARYFATAGYRCLLVHYVDRQWSDRYRGLRAIYSRAVTHLSPRRSANKFLAVFQRGPT